MYLYNITLIVETEAEVAVLGMVREFMQEDATEQPKLLRMLDSPHEGATYSLQLQVSDRRSADGFREGRLATLQSALNAAYPQKVYFFESLMEYV